MIVADTNLITYLFIAGDKTVVANQIYEHDPDWIVPVLWRHEFLNVLATYVKYGGANVEDVVSIWEESERFLSDRECSPNMVDALRLAAEHHLTAYDAQFVALAQSLDCWLVTEDQQLLKKLPDTACSMSQFLEMES